MEDGWAVSRRQDQKAFDEVVTNRNAEAVARGGGHCAACEVMVHRVVEARESGGRPPTMMAMVFATVATSVYIVVTVTCKYNHATSISTEIWWW